jgi:hypothetical protein
MNSLRDTPIDRIVIIACRYSRLFVRQIAILGPENVTNRMLFAARRTRNRLDNRHRLLPAPAIGLG